MKKGFILIKVCNKILKEHISSMGFIGILGTIIFYIPVVLLLFLIGLFNNESRVNYIAREIYNDNKVS